MKKNLYISTIIFGTIFLLSLIILVKDHAIDQNVDKSTNNNSITQSGIIFYYGDTCPHCKVVEKYLDENKIKDKVGFTSKEVYNNAQNSQELLAKAKICGIPANSIGVPFLWDGQKCITGDQPIIDFFSAKVGSAPGEKK